MAFGILPAPGTQHGPCADPCEHIDCAATRQQAESSCRLCGKPIGYNVPFYTDPEPAQPLPARPLVHRDCLEDAYEAQRKE